MDEFNEAERNLKQIIVHQGEQLKQANQKIAKEYLSSRAKADHQSLVSSQLINDLRHQITVLENIKNSGIHMQPSMCEEVGTYLEQYKNALEQLEENNKKVEQQHNLSQNQGLALDKDKSMLNKSSNMSSNSQSLIQHEDYNYQTSTLSLDSNLNPNLQQSSQQKTRKFKDRMRSIKRMVGLCMEYTNFAVMLAIILYILFGVLF